MSALPKPEPPPAQSDAEGWALLEGLRRRLDDQQVSQRATQTQVTQLAESIGALVELHRRRIRGLNLNSFVAYLIFTMLCGAGAYLLFRSRASELVDARDRAAAERDTATKRADDATAKLAARTDAEARAWEVFQLLETGKRADAKTKLAALAPLPLSRTERAVLDARAHESQISEIDAALKAAAAAFKAGHYGDVVAPLSAALATEPAGSRASQMRYYLGVAYAKAGDLDKSIAMLTAVTDADQEDARFQLASALDRKGDFVRARAEYDRFATAHPQSPLAVFAMRRSATLAHPPAVVPPRAVAPVAPIPPKPAAIVPPETTRGEAMSRAPGVEDAMLAPAPPAQTLLPDDALALASHHGKPKPKQKPAPPSPQPAEPAPPTTPCAGSCLELPQPPKAAPLPGPSPWLPPLAPEKPEPTPQPGPPAPQPAPPQPFAM